VGNALRKTLARFLPRREFIWRDGEYVYYAKDWLFLSVTIDKSYLLNTDVGSPEAIEKMYEYLNVSGKVVADVGAFLGETSIYFVKKRGARLVHAYEPFYYEFTKRNIALNGLSNSVIIHPYGLWIEEGRLKVAPGISDVGLEPGNIEIKVKPMSEAITIADVVKLDCEGCEWALLALPCDVIRHAEEYAIEIHGPAPYLVWKMEKCGYKGSRIEDERLISMWHFTKT
jgi:FkbM family methyltransferase